VAKVCQKLQREATDRWNPSEAKVVVKNVENHNATFNTENSSKTHRKRIEILQNAPKIHQSAPQNRRKFAKSRITIQQHLPSPFIHHIWSHEQARKKWGQTFETKTRSKKRAQNARQKERLHRIVSGTKRVQY